MIINREIALYALGALVAEVGENFRYNPPIPDGAPSCFYQVGGKPSCGVGRVLAKLGVEIAVLKKLDKEAGTFGDTDTQAILLKHAGVSVAPDARNLLHAFQAHQDQGVLYGEALRRARAEEDDPGD